MSRLLGTSDEDIARAADALRGGRLVAFPTETVYGLGAAARDPAAVARIYRAKGRPSSHPVIVHLASREALPGWAREVPGSARALADAFWPGPLTLVLPRADGVPDEVTGGQATVALRVPGHPLALGLLRAFGDGVAAPSANRFGGISPTTAAHVVDEFAQLDVLVLDGGACSVGLESTIVDVSGGRPRLLRPGGVPREAVEGVLGERLLLARHLLPELEEGEAPEPPYTPGAGADAPRAPGGLPRHYAPATPARTVRPKALADQLRTHPGAGVLARRPAADGFGGPWLRMPDDPEAYGRALYAALRRLDASGCSCILIEAVPATAPWLAIRDRLRRATEPAPEGAREAGEARDEREGA